MQTSPGTEYHEYGKPHVRERPFGFWVQLRSHGTRIPIDTQIGPSAGRSLKRTRAATPLPSRLDETGRMPIATG
jgi:hypothetical protein